MQILTPIFIPFSAQLTTEGFERHKKGEKMNGLFHASEKMKCNFANLYHLQGEVYSAVRTEDTFVFGRQSKDMLEVITALSENTAFVYNDCHTKVYAMEVIEKRLKITVFPEQSEHFFSLSCIDEFIIGGSVGNRSMLIKTCRDLSDDEQEINMYYIDFLTDRIVCCNDIMMNASYHMPYISLCNGEEYISVESAMIDPYEIEEAKNAQFSYKNDILAAPLQSVVESLSKDEALKWNVVSTAKEGYYVTILEVRGSYIWFTETAVDEAETNIMRYNLSSGLIEMKAHVQNRIDKVVFDEDKLLCMYKWNDSDRMITIYNNQGEMISNINFSALMNENEEGIELYEILSILDERYIVFNATDYKSDGSYYQCRVVYDIAGNQFMFFHGYYVEYKGLFY